MQALLEFFFLCVGLYRIIGPEEMQECNGGRIQKRRKQLKLEIMVKGGKLIGPKKNGSFTNFAKRCLQGITLLSETLLA